MKTLNLKSRTLVWLAGLVCVLLAGGCGSGDSESPAATPANRVLTGNVSKGPLGGATIRVYEVDSRGQRQGPALAETTTDASGNWTLSIADQSGELVIESSGGTYVDEADPQPDPDLRRTITLDSSDTLSALLPATASTVAINIYTDALLRKSRHETQGANFFDVYELNRTSVNSAFGFDITTTRPADPIRPDPGATLQSRHYAMALGGAANAVNAIAIANGLPVGNYQVISALTEDLTDCVIDGYGITGPVAGVTMLPMDLNAEILRFRNNNFSAYLDTPVLAVDQADCARSGLLADTIAPEFAGIPGDFIVEATDDQGISSAAHTVQARLMNIQAVDDRDGAVSVVTDLPAFLAAGDTLVGFSASDAAGNTQSITLTITVMLPQAPTIVAPPDVILRPVGDLTSGNLGLPEVSDNVSTVAALLVENDAPAGGFAPGEYRITWTVTDEAGFSTQDVQQVNVGTLPGFDESVLDPVFTQLPTFPDPNEPQIPPIVRPVPNAAVASDAVAQIVDADGDRLSDLQEAVLGTDPYDADTDDDGVPDNVETELATDPLSRSHTVRIAATGEASVQRFSFGDTTPDTPAFVIYEPGLHMSQVRLSAPCDNVVLIGNVSTAADELHQARITGGMNRALTVAGCSNVRLYRMDFSDNPDGAIELIDTQAVISTSGFYRNYAMRGGAIRLLRSQLTVEQSVLHGNAAAMGGGAIWIDGGSTVRIVDSLLEK